jgi:hypothetical protein
LAGPTTICPARTTIVSSPSWKLACARFDHEQLRVGVPMQPRTGTGRRVHEDDRKRDVPVVGADELVGMLVVRKVVEVHHLGLLHQASRPVVWSTSMR